jgi:DNA-binding GntR family transcriptional regulator
MLNVPDQRLALQAYERILDLILSGEARPGDLLNERRLAEMFEMSRTPVRDALLMLESEGLLVRQGRRGLHIKHMRVEDFMDALQIRLLLEPALAQLAAGNVPAKQLDELEADFEAVLVNAGPSGVLVDREQTRFIDDRLHGPISDAAGNPQLSSIIRTLRRQTQIFDLKSLPERVNDTCREHIEIIAALRAGQGEQAAKAMTRHLEQVRASIIARLARL